MHHSLDVVRRQLVICAIEHSVRLDLLAEDEPTQLQATAYFDTTKGPFVRLVMVQVH
jgi:hypothetical protein